MDRKEAARYLHNLMDDNGVVPSLKGVDPWINKSMDPKTIEALRVLGYSAAANGTLYRTDKQGFLPVLMESMFNDRKMSKNKMLDLHKQAETSTPEDKLRLMQEAARWSVREKGLKVSLNSLYGALGNPYFRFFDIRQAEAITLSGQLAIQWIGNALNVYLNQTLKTTDVDYIIASDTDSVYLNLGPLVKKVMPKETDKSKIIAFLDKSCKQLIEPFIGKKYQELADYMNAYAQKMIMKREVIADRGIWTAKKRYILNVWNSEGVSYKTPKLKIMGIETTRSSTPQVIRDSLKEAIKIIMTQTESDLIAFVATQRDRFRTFTPEQIAFPRGVNNIGKYTDKKQVYAKGTPIHVKGSLLYNHWIKKLGLQTKYEAIVDGSKIKFLSLVQPNPIHESVIAFPGILPPELDLENYIDRDKQFESSFLSPLQTILSTIGWSYEPKSSLASMFGNV